MKKLSGIMALIVFLFSLRVYGFVLYENELSEKSVMLGGDVKAFFYVLHGDLLKPPIYFEPDSNGLPVFKDASPGMMGINVLRLKFETQWTNLFKFVFHYNMGMRGSTFMGGELAGASIGAPSAPNNMFPFIWNVIDEDRFLWQHTIDWLYFKFSFKKVAITIGRQPFTFGRTFLWSPVDLISTFSYTVVDPEYKPGMDGVRLDALLSKSVTLTWLLTLGEMGWNKTTQLPNYANNMNVDFEGSTTMARLRWSLPKVEFGFMTGFVRGDFVAGFDFFWDLKHVGLRLESTYTYAFHQFFNRAADQQFNRTCLSLLYKYKDLTLITEFYYQGVGENNPANYDLMFNNERVRNGEIFNLGQFYWGLEIEYKITPIFMVSLTSIMNLQDPSALLIPKLIFDVAKDVSILAGAFVPIGRKITLRTDNLDRPLFLHSEFGAYLYQYFMELKIAF